VAAGGEEIEHQGGTIERRLPQDGQDSMVVKTARLLKRVFHIDLEYCPPYGGEFGSSPPSRSLR
jgi:hypothetical protein